MDEIMMMHPTDWDGINLEGWEITEKLDGVRAFWDGATLWTRGGNGIRIPAGWLPSGLKLDGELYAGLGTRAKLAGAVRRGELLPGTGFYSFPVLDWEKFEKHVPSFGICKNMGDIFLLLERIQACGG